MERPSSGEYDEGAAEYGGMAETSGGWGKWGLEKWEVQVVGLSGLTSCAVLTLFLFLPIHCSKNDLTLI